MPDAISFAPPYLTDAEVDELCDGLTQSAAKCRFLQSVLKLPVRRKPNGRPLVMRADVDALAVKPRPADARAAARGPNLGGLEEWAKGRKRRA